MCSHHSANAAAEAENIAAILDSAIVAGNPGSRLNAEKTLSGSGSHIELNVVTSATITVNAATALPK